MKEHFMCVEQVTGTIVVKVLIMLLNMSMICQRSVYSALWWKTKLSALSFL